MGIYSEYLRLFHKELELNNALDTYEPSLNNPGLVMDITRRLLEVAKNGTILRVGNRIGHLTADFMAFESDSAHTNLFRALVNYCLDITYGWGVDTSLYNRREIDEAILIHDLPENETGDTPDNGSRNESIKLAQDHTYFDDFLNLYTDSESSHCFYIRKLLSEMEDKSTEEGRTLFVADKLSAILMMLCYDDLGCYPHAYYDDQDISEVNKAEIKLCELSHNDGYLLSEIWTVDFLFAREMTRYDDTGFFTAIIIMATLLVHGKWYNWREKQYLP